MEWLKNLIERILSLFTKKDEEGKKPINLPVNDPKPLPHGVDTGDGVRFDWLEKALEITGSFEGSGYDQVSGNFDGQAISAGILQWNYGQGSLQSKILNPIIKKFGLDPFDVFPMAVSNTAWMNPQEAKAYAKKHMLDYRGRVKPEWIIAWQKFLTSPEGLITQKDAAQEIGMKALKLCQHYRLFSQRSFSFFFDVVTQNGSMKGLLEPSQEYVIGNFDRLLREDAGINYELWKDIEVDLQQMTLWVMITQRVVRNRWASDVLSRKGTIIFGKGVVHGSTRSFKFDTK